MPRMPPLGPPLCTTRWVMRLPTVDTFLVHYHEILEFLESIKEDYTEPANNREKADSFLRNLETFTNYFCLRVIQKILQATSPIHVQCQGKGATVGQVKNWVNTLILTLTAEWQGQSNSDELYEAVKTLTTVELHLDLPSLPRANRTRAISAVKSDAVTDEQIKDFYTSLYKSVIEAGAKALIDRYSKNDLSIVELLRRCLEDETTTNEDITTLAEYYNGDIDLSQLVFERNNWFARCKRMSKEANISTLRKTIIEEESLKFLLPNLHMLCVVYVCLPVTTCEAERVFSMLRAEYIHTSETHRK